MEQADLVLAGCSPLLFHCVAGHSQQTLDRLLHSLVGGSTSLVDSAVSQTSHVTIFFRLSLFIYYLDNPHRISTARLSPDWSITVTKLLSPRRSTINSYLLRLCFQAVIYSVWRERNRRKHTGAYRTAQKLTWLVDKTIQKHLLSTFQERWRV